MLSEFLGMFMRASLIVVDCNYILVSQGFMHMSIFEFM